MRKHIFFVMLGSLLFAGCALKGPDSISVIVDPGRNGTITVDKDEIRFGEVLEITVIPNDGYRLTELQPEDAIVDPYDSTKYYYIPNSGTTPKRRETPVTSVTVKATFTSLLNRTENFYVISSVKNGSIQVEGDSAAKHAGDTISFKLFVDEGYNLLDSVNGVHIRCGEDNISYIIDADGNYIFEMPESSVYVEADIVNDVYLQASSCLFVEKGKDLTISVRNLSDYTTFNAYISKGKTEEDVLAASDVIIENNQVVIPSANMDVGYYDFYLSNESEITSNQIDIRVGYAGYDEQWTSAIIKSAVYSEAESNVVLTYEPSLPRVLLKSHFAEQTETTEKCFSAGGISIKIPFEQTTEEQNIVVSIDDPYLKIISSDFSFTIPAKEVEPEENPEETPEENSGEGGQSADE